jgi:DNA-binding CsgD family transcriptional regulator
VTRRQPGGWLILHHIDPDLRLLIRQLIERAEALRESYNRRPSDSGLGDGDGEVLLDIEVDRVRCVLVGLPAPGPRPSVAKLSPREREVARMVAKGCTNRIIADALAISLWTVDTHLRRIFAKLDVCSRAAMVATIAGTYPDIRVSPPALGRAVSGPSAMPRLDRRGPADQVVRDRPNGTPRHATPWWSAARDPSP